MDEATARLYELVQQVSTNASGQAYQSRQNRLLIVGLMQEMEKLSPGAFDRIMAVMESEMGPLEPIEHDA